MRACAKAGKPFICEKPVSDNLPGAVACVEATARAGVVAAMGLNRRLDADMRELSERLRGGEVGAVESVHIVSRGASSPAPESVPFSGGMIRDKGAHFNDIACWFVGSEPVEVYATGACLIDPHLADYGDVDTAALVVGSRAERSPPSSSAGARPAGRTSSSRSSAPTGC